MKKTVDTNFWIIFDTCTRPEYYQDVHNLLCLPAGSILRYNYNKKYFDELSISLTSKDSYPKDVLLLYGQFEKYDKGASNDVFRSFKESNQKYFIIPTRIALLKAIQVINEEIYLDIELGEYPYIRDIDKITSIIDSIKNTIPFSTPSKYVLISNCLQDFNYLKLSGSNKDNWAVIINKFQENKNQFHEDSFWRLEGPFMRRLEVLYKRPLKLTFERRDKLIEPSLYFSTENEKKNNFQHYYTIKEGVGFYFHLYNYEPKTNIKAETYKDKVVCIEDIERYNRKIKIVDTYSPVISFLKQIDLRQYFITKIKFQKNYSPDFITKEGACYFKTNGQINEWPMGPNFYIYFKLKKNLLSIIFGLISILSAIGFTIYSAEIVKQCLWCGIVYGIYAAAFFLFASILLFKQIRMNLVK